MNRLKELRKEKKLTQQELADKMGVTKRTIQKWEKGESQIKPDKAEKLADFFKVSVGFLLGFGTLEEEIEQSHKETLKRFQKENDILLSLGYLLSDTQIQNILSLIYSFSKSNGDYIWSLIEHDDKFIEKILESDFLSFIEMYPNFLKDMKQQYQQHLRDINDPIKQKQVKDTFKLIEKYQSMD